MNITENDLAEVRDTFWNKDAIVAFEPKFPLKYVPQALDGADWFKQKYQAACTQDPAIRADMHKKRLGHDDRPVVLYVDAHGEVRAVLDGNHRIGAALLRGQTCIPAFVGRYHELDEKAPPGVKAERFIKKAKKDFQTRYGKDWESRLYGTAWKLFGEGRAMHDDLRRSIDLVEAAMLTEEQLVENFLTQIAQSIGDYANRQVQMVTDLRSGLAVIYRVLRDATLCDSVTFELKRSVKRHIKSSKSQKLIAIADRFFPQGRGAKDFLMALLLNIMFEAARKVGNYDLSDAAIEVLSDALQNVLVVFSDVTQIGSLMKTLALSNDVVFSPLNQINKKINSVRIGPLP